MSIVYRRDRVTAPLPSRGKRICVVALTAWLASVRGLVDSCGVARARVTVPREDSMDKHLVEKHGKVYEAGTVLFREGEVGKRLYVINEGRIRITKRINKTEAPIEVLGPGEFCGELALVMEAPHPVTATVVEPAKLLIVDAKQFEMMVRSNGEIALRMMRKLAGRLTEAQFRIVNLQLRRPMARLLHQLKWEIAQMEEEFAPLLPDDLSEVLCMQRTEVDLLLQKVVKEGLVKVSEDGRFHVPDRVAFDRYLTYLELKDRYEFLD